MIQSNVATANLFADSQQAHLEALKCAVKILYDEKLSYEIIKYIVNLKGQPAEEEKMANDFNLKFDTVRQSLTRMGNDGILMSREYKKKKEELDDAASKKLGIKRGNTFEWTINETFYNIIKVKFEELKKKLEKKLEYMSKDKFECPKCKRVFELDEVAHKGYVCKQCDDKPKLIEIQAKDVSELRKRSNEIIMMLSEQFIIADKSGSGFQYMQVHVSSNRPTKEKKTVNNLNLLGKKEESDMQMEMLNPNEIIISNNLEDPEIEETLNYIKKDENKLKKFKELVELYTYK